MVYYRTIRTEDAKLLKGVNFGIIQELGSAPSMMNMYFRSSLTESDTYSIVLNGDCSEIEDAMSNDYTELWLVFKDNRAAYVRVLGHYKHPRDLVTRNGCRFYGVYVAFGEMSANYLERTLEK